MTKILRKTFVATMIIVVFAISTFVTIRASPEYNTLDKTTEFLSSVVGLDLTKYALVQPSLPVANGTPNDSNLKFSENNDLKIDGPSYDFKSETGTLHTLSMFYNEHLWYVKMSSDSKYIYSDYAPANITEQVTNLLNKYQKMLSEEYDIDGSFLTPMQKIFSANGLSNTNKTIDNIVFQLSNSVDKTRIQWVYAENGIIMNNKRVEITFRNNSIESFTDTWSLYKVSGFSEISSEEAKKIALEAAQKIELNIGHADGTNETINVPDLLNARYDMHFSMLPFHGDNPAFPSKLHRDPLTLYPCWQFHFYFDQNIGGDIGVQVGVWGDSKEIMYASGYGYLGLPRDYNLTSVQTINGAEQKLSSSNPLVSIAIIIAIVILANCILITLIKRRRQKN